MLRFDNMLVLIVVCFFIFQNFFEILHFSLFLKLYLFPNFFFKFLLGKTFTTKNALKIHLRTHREEKPTQCKECGRTFIRVDCLVRHMRSKHRELLQKIITEAETEKIMTAQREMLEENENDGEKKEEGDEIEIILYKEDDPSGETENYVILPNEKLDKEAESDNVETFRLMAVNESTYEDGNENDGVMVLPYEEPVVPIIKSVTSEKLREIKTCFPTKKAAETVVASAPANSVPIIHNVMIIKQVKSLAVPEKPEIQSMVKLEEPDLKSIKEVVQEPEVKKESKKTPEKRVIQRKQQEVANKAPAKRGRPSKESLPAKKTKTDTKDSEESVLFMPDEIFQKKLEELLATIVEDNILTKFGFKKKPIEDVLIAVLEECDREPIKKDNVSFKGDEMTRMRENAKIFFTLCLEPEQLAVLINNHTVDELVHIILGFAKEN